MDYRDSFGCATKCVGGFSAEEGRADADEGCRPSIVTDLSLSKLTTLSTDQARPAVSPAASFGVSAVALGFALQVNFGQFDPAARWCLAVAILAGAIGLINLAGGKRSAHMRFRC